ncbi:MAG TPA: DUF1844 domain-containing protein [Candidatus Aquilonibacter sp.]|nr:DUF1844 domain-containing protein [Candidatus Aquilonibacter sp.]
MAEKRQNAGFTVTDKRLFTEDGELRGEAREEESREPETKTEQKISATSGVTKEGAAKESAASEKSAAPLPEAGSEGEVPPPPTDAEQQAQADAYRASSKDLDSRVEMSGRSAKEFEMTFERFLASLYMSAMLQLGLMHQQGQQPQIDIIGARQTIDTLSLLAEKTKGNLTPAEANFLQNSLYEVRMAYVEVTNALARPPQPGAATGTGGR